MDCLICSRNSSTFLLWHFFSSYGHSCDRFVSVIYFFCHFKGNLGREEVGADAICWFGSSCSLFIENSGSSEENECKTEDQETEATGVIKIRNGGSQNQTHISAMERREYIDPFFFFLRNLLCWWKDKTQPDFLRLYQPIIGHIKSMQSNISNFTSFPTC